MDFLSNKLIDSFIHSYLNVWIQEEVEIELNVDFKCAPEEGEKLKVKGTSQVVRKGLVRLS